MTAWQEQQQVPECLQVASTAACVREIRMPKPKYYSTEEQFAVITQQGSCHGLQECLNQHQPQVWESKNPL
jgi:hypothetical protein